MRLKNITQTLGMRIIHRLGLSLRWVKKVLNIKYKKKIYLRRMFFQKNVETSKLLTTDKSKNNILYACFVIFFLGLLLIIGIVFVFFVTIKLIRK